MMWWNGDWSGWAWFAMSVSTLVFWALVGVAIWAVVRSVSSPSPRPTTPSAEEMLRQRYATGDLDDDEFARRLEMLRQHSGTRT
jgi:putative membrane protein